MSVRPTWILAALLPFGPVALAADPLTGLAAALDEPKLAEECVAVTAGKLSHGNLDVKLGPGTACAVTAAEARIGWFYAGRAEFRYVPRDRIEHPVVRYNVKTEGRVSVEDVEGGTVAVTGNARTVFFAASSGPFAELTGERTDPPDEAFRKHRTTFARSMDRSTAHTIGSAMLDRSTPATVRIELDEGDGPLVYTFEPVDERVETLDLLAGYVSEDHEVRKQLRTTTLSAQPIARDRKLPVPPPFLMTAVDYELTAPGGDAVTVTARATVVPIRDGLRVLRFEVPGNILVNSGPGNASAREYKVVSVTDGAGAALPFHRSNRDLLVDLGKPAVKGQPLPIAFRIEGNFLVRPNGDNYWILEGREIFPQPPWSGAQYTTHGVIRVKKPFVALASGTTVKRAEDGELNVLEVKSELPTNLPAIIAGKYAISEATKDGLTVRVATYAMKNERSQEQLSELAFGMIRHFERFLGPFPVTEFNIVQVNDLGWGQAPLGTMLITNEAFDRLLPQDIAQVFTEGINERFAHEIAHQWWGHAIRWPNDDEVWLSESFAEYCAGLMVKRAQGQGHFDNLKASWKARGKLVTKVAPVALTNQLSSKDVATYWDNRFGLLYSKGPWLLAKIHDEIGDDKFLLFLKSYQKTLHGKPGSTKLAIELLKVVSGKDYTPFFDANFWGTGMPN